ncbi:uncharacterized protein LOC121394203 [Xenopus laevis]|uniref:Uncharacterized protein LOC121394203 n=1 Tax=Xenopus laevis TaxID=8355 RepID=A0A8J1KSY9_XENLA|nr:uncharacterized protein LOC121394203 [Xenopus laevis]
MGESRLLNRGLKFVPTNWATPFETYKDIHKFKRQLKLKDFFKEQAPTTPVIFKAKSTFDPPNTAPSISTFTHLLSRDLWKLHNTKMNHFANLTRVEREAIKTLQADKDIIIRQADKGGGIVILDKTYYVDEITKQLSDTDTYVRLKGDPTVKFKQKLDTLINTAVVAGWVDENTKRFLTTDFPKIPFLYTLPKIHKSLSAPPGRPIISAVGSLFQPIAIFIDHYLQPIVQQMDSYVKDTTHLLTMLKELRVPPDSILATMDVSSLYTVIPHEAGIAVCREALSRIQVDGPPVEFLIALLDLILSHNYFMFNDKFFLQVAGTAMGSNVAPSFANLCMESYEKTVFLPRGGSNIYFYKRYIDDLLLVWGGTARELTDFHASLNEGDSPIKLTLSHDTQTIDFLDVTLYKQGEGLGTTLYKKPTDKNSLIQAQSHHPTHMSRGVLYSQFLRIIRNNSDRNMAQTQLTTLTEQFVARGYDRTLVIEQRRRAELKTQDDLLKPGLNTRRAPPDLIFSTQWTEISGETKRALRNRWEIIQSDQSLPFANQRPLLAYKRGRNLGDLLVTKDVFVPPRTGTTWLDRPLKKGCYKCAGCLTCSGMLQGAQFSHPSTGVKFDRHRVTCTSDHVVYMAWCPCGLYYVGKAGTSYRERMNNHRCAIRMALTSGKADQPVARHWLKLKHSLPQFRHMIIDHVPVPRRGGNRGLMLIQRETQWIFKLDTLAPKGLNETLPMSSFY